MNRRKTGIIAIAVVAGVLAVSVWRALYSKFTYKASESIEEIQKKAGVPVVVAEPVRTNLVARLVLDAVIEPKERALVMANVEGNIVRIHVDEGDRVEAGDRPTLLVEIDESEPRAAQQAAEAALNDAETNFERAKKLIESGGISQQEFDLASVLFERGRANLVAAENMLADCSIYSPISGYVAKRYVDPGAVTSKGKLLMEIMDTSSGLKADIRIPEKKIKHIRRGIKCRIFIEATGDDEPVESVLSTVNPALDPVTRELAASCPIAGAGRNIVPGMFARAEVEYDSRRDVIAVPDDAVLVVGDKTGVYVVESDGTAKFRVVETGLRDNAYVEIISGLSGDERVIVEGNRQISAGMKVAVK